MNVSAGVHKGQRKNCNLAGLQVLCKTASALSCWAVLRSSPEAQHFTRAVVVKCRPPAHIAHTLQTRPFLPVPQVFTEHVLGVWPQVSSSVSLCFCFPLSEMGVLIRPAGWGCY